MQTTQVPALGRHAWDELAGKLVEMVISGELQPGQRLVEAELADRFGISRGPVRTALQHLERSGLAETRLRRGMVVVEMTPADVRELYAVRIALEEAAVAALAERSEGVDWTAMAQYLDKMEAAAERGDTVEATYADLEFHRAMIQAAGNSRLLRAWEPLSSQIRLVIGTLQREDDATVRPLYADHRRILDMLRSDTPTKAASVLDHHLRNSRDVMIAHVEGLSSERSESS